MSPLDAIQRPVEHEYNSFYTQFAQTFVDYNGCLPQDDDAADHYNRNIRVTKIS